jgi:hypothetical protein
MLVAMVPADIAPGIDVTGIELLGGLMLDTIIGRADNARLRSSLGAAVSKIKFEICVR